MLREFHLSKNFTLKEVLKKNELDIHMAYEEILKSKA